MKRILAFVCFFSSLAFGQGSLVPAQQALKTVNGVTTPIPNATITVCSAGVSGIPCSPASINIFKDAALTQPLSNPMTADSLGNYVFAVTPGNYTVTVTAAGFAGYSYQVTASLSPSANNTFTGTNQYSGSTTFNGPVTLNGATNAVLTNPTATQNITGQALNLTASAPLTVAAAPSINKTVYWDGTTYPFTTTGLQAALTAACNGAVPGKVVMPPGAPVSMSTNLNIPNNCDFGGAGPVPTQLTFPAAQATCLLCQSSSPATNITLHDMIIDGGSGTSGSEQGINFNNGSTSFVTNVRIERVTVQNVGSYGINLGGVSSNFSSGVVVHNSRIINAGLVGTQLMYAILVSDASNVEISGNECTGNAIRYCVNAFGNVVTSAATPIQNVRIVNNNFHDINGISCAADLGGAIDVGRVTGVVIQGNTFRNLNCGSMIVLESDWNVSVTGNVSFTNNTGLSAAQGSVVLKTPDTTLSGETSNQNVVFSHNAITQLGAVAPVVVTIQHALQSVSFDANQIIMNNIGSVVAVWLQMARTDANLNGGNYSTATGVSVTNNNITNLATLVSNVSLGIGITQTVTTFVPDEILVANNTIRGYNTPIFWSSASASNGLTHVYIHDNAEEGNNGGILNNDGKTYSTLYYWNHLPPTGTNIQTDLPPPIPKVGGSSTFAFWSGAAGSDGVINLGRTVSEEQLVDIGAAGDYFTDSQVKDFAIVGTGTNVRLGIGGGGSALALSSTGVLSRPGLQIFNVTTTCTTAASVGATCTTGAISLPVTESDTSYRVVCVGKTVTAVPVVITTTNSSTSQFTITIAALTAVAASFGSYDCVAGHN